MNIAVGDRVRALEDCRMAGRGSSRYFYRAGDTGSVVRFDGLGAWVKWDGNPIDDGVWYASTEVLALIEEDASGIDVTNRINPLDTPLAAITWIDAHRAPAERTGVELVRQLDDHYDAVADLAKAAADAAELLESVAPHHPQAANLRAALARCRGGAA